MVPNMCKIPTKPWFLGGANIRGLPNTIRYTTKYHPNIKNYSRCLLLGGLVLREGILWQEYDGFFEGTLNYQSSWEIYLTTQIYDKSRFSRHRWTKKEKEITETPIIWRFPIMGVPPNHQVIRPWLSIFKQPWWLGIPHDVRTPIFSPYSPSFTKFGYVFFSSCLLVDRSCGCFVRSSRLWLDSSCVRSGRNLRAFGFQFPAAPEDRWERSLDVAWKGWGPYSTCLKESSHPPEKIGPPNLLNCSFIWDSWPNRWIIWPASQAPQWRISQMGDSDSDSKTWKNGPAEAAERVINPIPKIHWVKSSPSDVWEVSTCPGRFSKSSNRMSSSGCEPALVAGDDGTTLTRMSGDAADLSWSPKAMPWAGTEVVACFRDLPSPRPLQDKIKGPDKPTSQLLQIIRNSDWSKTEKAGKTKEMVEDR